jgi:hypothetical protein
MGMYSVRHVKNITSFQTEAAVSGAKDFAKKLISE